MSEEQKLLSYQWLEYLAMYADQAVNNPIIGKNFLLVYMLLIYYNKV